MTDTSPIDTPTQPDTAPQHDASQPVWLLDGYVRVSTHQAEAWRQGYVTRRHSRRGRGQGQSQGGSRVRFGWWCLTCEAEGDSTDAAAALVDAAEHETQFIASSALSDSTQEEDSRCDR